MPTPQRVTQPSDLIDWSVVHEDAYDLAPDWQQPRPDVAGAFQTIPPPPPVTAGRSAATLSR